ncbi:uncharacterized protein [Castor canadensis]|uniref:Uncharacterized protein n=1 Tax=Castor canadensis TaxID=51338 RepID=A0AC58LE05_CASCN
MHQFPTQRRGSSSSAEGPCLESLSPSQPRQPALSSGLTSSSKGSSAPSLPWDPRGGFQVCLPRKLRAAALLTAPGPHPHRAEAPLLGETGARVRPKPRSAAAPPAVPTTILAVVVLRPLLVPLGTLLPLLPRSLAPAPQVARGSRARSLQPAQSCPLGPSPTCGGDERHPREEEEGRRRRRRERRSRSLAGRGCSVKTMNEKRPCAASRAAAPLGGGAWRPLAPPPGRPCKDRLRSAPPSARGSARDEQMPAGICASFNVKMQKYSVPFRPPSRSRPQPARHPVPGARQARARPWPAPRPLQSACAPPPLRPRPDGQPCADPSQGLLDVLVGGHGSHFAIRGTLALPLHRVEMLKLRSTLSSAHLHTGKALVEARPPEAGSWSGLERQMQGSQLGLQT